MLFLFIFSVIAGFSLLVLVNARLYSYLYRTDEIVPAHTISELCACGAPGLMAIVSSPEDREVMRQQLRSELGAGCYEFTWKDTQGYGLQMQALDSHI